MEDKYISILENYICVHNHVRGQNNSIETNRISTLYLHHTEELTLVLYLDLFHTENKKSTEVPRVTQATFINALQSFHPIQQHI